jgi:DNA-binding NtrC family response regulator
MSSSHHVAGTNGASASATSSLAPSLRDRVRQATRQIESEIILETLEQHRWNRRRTAEALRISYRLLMYKMKSGNLRDASVAQRTGGAEERREVRSL